MISQSVKVLDVNSVAVGELAVKSTVVSGAIRYTGYGTILIEGEGDVADILANITGASGGEIAVVRASDGTKTITVADTGNILLAGDVDCLLAEDSDSITLQYVTSVGKWCELSRMTKI